MKNVRVKVIESCGGTYWYYAICQGKKQIWIMEHGSYDYKYSARRAAKAMAERIGIPYDPEIIKQKGC